MHLVSSGDIGVRLKGKGDFAARPLTSMKIKMEQNNNSG